uniref:Uncharacterized protein n=1 Tax=Anopheles farauti TaxID=69004 RepID=A0A182QR38_9DIPT
MNPSPKHNNWGSYGSACFNSRKRLALNTAPDRYLIDPPRKWRQTVVCVYRGNGRQPRSNEVASFKACQIKTLTVSNTSITEAEFQRNEYIRYVSICRGPLKEIPDTINNLMNLVSVRFEFTDIERLEMRLFCSMPRLVALNLISNKITTIVGMNDTVCSTSLGQLNLIENAIVTLDLNVFSPFRNLRYLDLTYNMLKAVTGQPSNTAIQYLMLCHNALSEHDFCSIDKPGRLTNLQMSNNNLTRVPPCLHKLNNLTIVTLEHNQIDSVDLAELKPLSKLEYINLSFNNITALPTDESLYPPKLKVLHLFKNPLDVNFSTQAFERIRVSLNSYV